jgi:hypothetical protein
MQDIVRVAARGRVADVDYGRCLEINGEPRD